MSGFSALDFEVFRHALWEVNEEQGLAAVRTSASHVVYESYDMNTSVLDASGRGLVSGAYVSLHSTTLDTVVQSVLEMFGDSIRPGDIFITNDPWAGALHLSDYASVSPFFVDDELLFWTGLVMHEVDVGGPVPGSFSVGSHEVWGEAPIVPPMRLAREGALRPEAVALLMRNTRTPELVRVNLSVRVAVAHVGEERLSRIVEKYGVEKVRAGQQQIIDHVAQTLRQRLATVPDGVWRERAWIDHDGVDDVHLKLEVALRKSGGKLFADFTGTDPQARGGVNCTRPGLEGAVVSAIFSMLCFDIPWSSAGVKSVVEMLSTPGSVNDAQFPAAVSMASVSGAWVTARIVGNALGKMLACSADLEGEAQAMWNPAFHGIVFAGTSDDGERVTFFPLDQEAGGGGARSRNDGIDAGSNLHSICNAIPNVERNELLYPFLQVWRRLRTDSGGPGEYRGGCGVELLYAPYGVRFPVEAIIFSAGDDQPGAMGIAGGYPGSIQRHVLLRGSDLFDQFREGRAPADEREVGCVRREVLPPKTRETLQAGDVLWTFMSGGGGFGDPLERPLEAVREDLGEGLVSERTAVDLYGYDPGLVEAPPGPDKVPGPAEVPPGPDKVPGPAEVPGPAKASGLGESRGPAEAPDRQASREARLREAISAEQATVADLPQPGGGAMEMRARVGRALQVVSDGKREFMACRCGHVLSSLPGDPKLGCAKRAQDLAAASELNGLAAGDLFELRQYLCPSCGILIGTQVCPKGESELYADLEIAGGHGLD